MLQIDGTLISLDVIEKTFVCDLGACKGGCCVEGDSGAPLEDDETQQIEEVYPIIKKYMGSKQLGSVKMRIVKEQRRTKRKISLKKQIKLKEREKSTTVKN